MKLHWIIVLSFCAVLSVSQAPPNCLRPLKFGNTCSTAEPSIRYHFDNETNLCMAFKYNGCGGNKNSFETEGICQAVCLPTDLVGCPLNRKPVEKADGTSSCTLDTDCPDNGYCRKRLSGSGLCCKTAVRDKMTSDYNPSCATGRSVVKVDDSVLIGKNCSSNFCPDSSNCRKGNFFSTCCGKN